MLKTSLSNKNDNVDDEMYIKSSHRMSEQNKTPNGIGKHNVNPPATSD